MYSFQFDLVSTLRGNGRSGPGLQEGILGCDPQCLLLHRGFDCSNKSMASETVGRSSQFLVTYC